MTRIHRGSGARLYTPQQLTTEGLSFQGSGVESLPVRLRVSGATHQSLHCHPPNNLFFFEKASPTFGVSRPSPMPSPRPAHPWTLPKTSAGLPPPPTEPPKFRSFLSFPHHNLHSCFTLMGVFLLNFSWLPFQRWLTVCKSASSKRAPV